MWIIFLSLGVGIVIGAGGIIPKSKMKYNATVQEIGLLLIIFSMGASLGSNKVLISSLKNMGLKALTFAIFTTIFSTLFVFISSQFIK